MKFLILYLLVFCSCQGKIEEKVFSTKDNNDEFIEIHNDSVDIFTDGTDYIENNMAAGTVSLAGGEFEEAIKFFNRVLEIDPNYSEAYHRRGITYSYMDDYEKAINDYRRALDVDIHFIADTSSFLSEGDKNVLIAPDMSEGDYEELLEYISEVMFDVLSLKPNQIFLIIGYSADIPGHNVGEWELSAQRAERVLDVLALRYGVSEKNLVCLYRGGTNKWGDNFSERTRKPNRVVKIEFYN
jgi:tetratricopeptide (TPR) repeat protein